MATRRHVLISGALSLIVPEILSPSRGEAKPSLAVKNGHISEVVAEAQRLGINLPARAPGQASAAQRALDLSQITDEALARGLGDEAASALAERAGALLSKINQSLRDPV